MINTANTTTMQNRTVGTVPFFPYFFILVGTTLLFPKAFDDFYTHDFYTFLRACIAIEPSWTREHSSFVVVKKRRMQNSIFANNEIRKKELRVFFAILKIQEVWWKCVEFNTYHLRSFNFFMIQDNKTNQSFWDCASRNAIHLSEGRSGMFYHE